MCFLMRRSIWCWLLVFSSMATCSGCGGDAYEKKFDESMQHLKSTGLPLGREPAPPPQANSTAPDQQPAPAEQPQNN
jgi:hypothetical protein